MARPPRNLTYEGRTQSLTDWANEIGLNVSTLRARIDHYDWPLDKALTTKARKLGPRLLTWDGVTKPLIEWAKETGLSVSTIHNRIFLYNWTVEDALTTPVGRPTRADRLITHNGKTQTIRDWSKQTGIPSTRILARLEVLSWTPERALTVTGDGRVQRLITAQGRTQTLAQWARETGLHITTIKNRIDILGWTEEDAVTKPLQRHRHSQGNGKGDKAHE